MEATRCPQCGVASVPFRPAECLVALVIGLDCCGYVPTVKQALRWALIERWRLGWDRAVGWRLDELRLRHRFPRPR